MSVDLEELHALDTPEPTMTIPLDPRIRRTRVEWRQPLRQVFTPSQTKPTPLPALRVVDRPRNPITDRLINRDQLANLPEPEPLIEDTLDRRTMAMLVGYHGSMKSFLALDWSACIATGKPWQGRPVQQGTVLYVAAEGAYGLHKRLAAWEYAWDREIMSDAFVVMPDPVNMCDPAEVRNLLAVVDDLDPALVVLDTLARCAVGFDENSATDMGLYVNNVDRVRKHLSGGTVLSVHHTGKDKATLRGSSALEAGHDTVYLARGDAGLVGLERTKRKDGPMDDVHQLRLKVLEQIGSGVIESTRGADMTRASDQVMSAFMSAFSATGATKAELRNAAEMPSASFSRGLNLLVERGLLRNSGTDKRPHYVLPTTGGTA